MKRVKAACICQTLCFMAKDDIPKDIAIKQVRQEVEQYKAGLERTRTRYNLIEKIENEDGTITVKIIKQYNASPVGDYLK